MNIRTQFINIDVKKALLQYIFTLPTCFWSKSFKRFDIFSKRLVFQLPVTSLNKK